MHKNVYVLFFLTLLQSGVSFCGATPPVGLKDEFPPIGFTATPPVGLMPPVLENGNAGFPPID